MPSHLEVPVHHISSTRPPHLAIAAPNVCLITGSETVHMSSAAAGRMTLQTECLHMSYKSYVIDAILLDGAIFLRAGQARHKKKAGGAGRGVVLGSISGVLLPAR